MAKERKATGINSWPEDDRPREKLLKKGAGALSNSELLAILLRTGTNGTSAIDLARKILQEIQHLPQHGAYRHPRLEVIRGLRRGQDLPHSGRP